MTEGRAELPKVNLSRLKFANWQEPVEEKGSDNDSEGNETNPVNTPRNARFPKFPFPFDFRRPEAYERMAADKPGEEMAHDATIWKLYLEEAVEHDQELVKGRQSSLDMLLLFAALFSAILTAFLIESKGLLQQDPADASAALLLLIAQSQHRMELGIQPPALNEFPSSPTFTPLPSARWINGIWFTSLALSLSAALIAMLSKEWLTAYLSSRPRHAYSHALLRQSRMEGLERWWALHFISLLPSLLHLSLLLFSVGLVIYLWMLDKAIASVIAGVIGLTAIFYGSTAILGAIYDYCPYVTQISGYLQTAYHYYRGNRAAAHENHSIFTSELDLRALLWLANNARDPSIVDCSYQVLAGLRLPHDFAGARPSDSASDAAVVLEDKQSPGAMIKLDKQTTLGALFLTVSDRFERLMRTGGELSTSSWENAARYGRVLVELAGYIKRHDPSGRLIPEEDEEESGLAWFRGEKDAALAQYQSLLRTEGPSQFAYSLTQVLNAFVYLWRDEVPSFPSDVYASFVATELFLLSYAAPNESKLTVAPRNSLDDEDKKFTGDHSIEMTTSAHTSRSGIDLFNLRAQYSRALTRASTLIWFHTQHKATIGSVSLNRLLNALYTSASCDALNPTTSLSTHHPQSTASDSNEFQFVMPYNASSWYYYNPLDLSGGLLGDLTALLRMSPKGQEDAALQTRILAVRAFSALAPVLMQQTLGVERPKLRSHFDYSSWPDAAKLDMNAVRYVASRQALELVRFISPHLEAQAGHITQCCNSLRVVGDYLTEHQEQGYSALLAMAHSGDGIIPLLDFAASSEEHFNIVAPKAVFLLIDQVRLHLEPGLALCNTLFPPSSFPPLIRMVEHSSNDAQPVQELLQLMLKRVRDQSPEPFKTLDIPRLKTPGVEYLHRFTRMAEGFSAFISAALEEKHAEPVATGAAQIIRLAAGNDPEYSVKPVELHADAVPGFLGIISMVANFCTGKSDQDKMLFDFSGDVIRLLATAPQDEASKLLMVQHSAYHDLRSALVATGEDILKRERLQQMDKLRIDFDIRDKAEEGRVPSLKLTTNSPYSDKRDADQAHSAVSESDQPTSENQTNSAAIGLGTIL
ncbi:hypothetical protein FS749_003431 [Ceratobasidium sp. UAMH 11750]|nr:hypothetical protein FS749_003431 [Ceratobasidium sp. UAMH 11750]